MPAATTYLCKACPLNDGYNHHHPKLDRLAHQSLIEAYQNELDQCATDFNSIDDVGNVFTGLIVADASHHPRDQGHSRLFSSRDAFQDTIADVPTAFVPLSRGDVVASIYSVIGNTLSTHSS